MTEDNKNLPATIQNNPLIIPDYLKDDSGVAGMENVTKSELIIPRLGLCQSQSAEKQPASPKYIDGLQEGEFFNSVTKEIYGKELYVSTFYYFKNRIKFVSKTDKTIECISMNAINGGSLSKTCADCKYSKFIVDEKGNLNQPCTGFFNYLISPIIVDMTTGEQHLKNETLAFGLKRTSVKISKQWNSLIMARNKKMWSGLYKISTAVEQNKNGQYYLVPVVNNAGWVTEKIFKSLGGLYEMYKDTGVKATSMDLESAVEEATETHATTTSHNPGDYVEDDIPF